MKNMILKLFYMNNPINDTKVKTVKMAYRQKKLFFI